MFSLTAVFKGIKVLKDTLSQTKKTAPPFCILKRKHVHFYMGEEVVLQLKVKLFFSSATKLVQSDPVKAKRQSVTFLELIKHVWSV